MEVDYTGIPKELADLMKKDKVTPAQIRQVVANRGYYPVDTPIYNYDPGFIQAVLVAAWDQVVMAVMQLDLPF